MSKCMLLPTYCLCVTEQSAVLTKRSAPTGGRVDCTWVLHISVLLRAKLHDAEHTVTCACRSNLSSLSSATFWSNGGSTDVNDMSSKLLHGLSQMDADTLTSLSSGRCPDSGACMPCLETLELHLFLHPCQCIGHQLHSGQTFCTSQLWLCCSETKQMWAFFFSLFFRPCKLLA